MEGNGQPTVASGAAPKAPPTKAAKVVRALAVTGGLIGIGFGLYLAWGSKNSVLFVATGALLLAIGLIGADWREIVAKFGDSEITVRRAEQVARAANEVEELARRFDELVERVDTQPDVGEAIKDEVRRQTAAIRTEARSIAGGITLSTTPVGSNYDWSSPRTFSVGSTYRATAAVAEKEVQLALERSTTDYIGSSADPFTCTVTAPDGSTWTAGDPTKFYFLGVGTGVVASFKYPSDFGNAPFNPGTYSVQWTRRSSYVSLGLSSDNLANTTFTLSAPAKKATTAAKKASRKPSA